MISVCIAVPLPSDFFRRLWLSTMKPELKHQHPYPMRLSLTLVAIQGQKTFEEETEFEERAAVRASTHKS